MRSCVWQGKAFKVGEKLTDWGGWPTLKPGDEIPRHFSAKQLCPAKKNLDIKKVGERNWAGIYLTGALKRQEPHVVTADMLE